MFSFGLRMIIITFKPWGFESSSIIMWACGVLMLLFFVIRELRTKKRNRYFKY